MYMVPRSNKHKDKGLKGLAVSAALRSPAGPSLAFKWSQPGVFSAFFAPFSILSSPTTWMTSAFSIAWFLSDSANTYFFKIFTLWSTLLFLFHLRTVPSGVWLRPAPKLHPLYWGAELWSLHLIHSLLSAWGSLQSPHALFAHLSDSQFCITSLIFIKCPHPLYFLIPDHKQSKLVQKAVTCSG